MAAAPAPALERNLRRFIAPPRVVEKLAAFENDGLLAHKEGECNHSRRCCALGRTLVNVLSARLAGRADLPQTRHQKMDAFNGGIETVCVLGIRCSDATTGR